MDRIDILKQKPVPQNPGRKKKYRIVKNYSRAFKRTDYQVQRKVLFFWFDLHFTEDEYATFKSEAEAEEFIRNGCPNPYGTETKIVKYIEA
jgi:hypothetical protein